MLQPRHNYAANPDTLTAQASSERPDLPPSQIISVTLAGPGTAEMIRDALRSVTDHVDKCLLIDTSIGTEGIAAASDVVGERLIVRSHEWTNDFAEARNAALAYAAQTGAAWAIMLDTDERLNLDRSDLKHALASTDHDLLTLPNVAGTYAKPRVFRLPAAGTWIGQTHEFFDLHGSEGPLPNASFDEIGKSPERLHAKLTRDVAVLRQMTGQHPHQPRWWYYLGDTLSNLDDKPGAIAAFDRCASLDGWNEEAAWARYRQAECWLALGNEGEAIRSCAAGLARHPGIAELAWLAGFASWKAKRYEQAVQWSQLALVHGALADGSAVATRIGFRNPMALHEGPYDVLRYAWRALGNTDAADEAERNFRDARDRRLGNPAI